jgi:hypothetical protein
MQVLVPAASFLADAKLTSPEAKRARELHNAILDTAKAIRDISDRYGDAVRTVMEADAEVREYLHGPETNDQHELRLADELRLARLKADPGAHAARVQGAKERHELAIQAYVTYVQYNLPALRDELAPEAEAATKALADARAALAPVEQRYADIYRHVNVLLQHVRPTRTFTPEEIAAVEAWALPTDGVSVPLPDPDVVAAWAQAHPAPVQRQPANETVAEAAAAE